MVLFWRLLFYPVAVANTFAIDVDRGPLLAVDVALTLVAVFCNCCHHYDIFSVLFYYCCCSSCCWSSLSLIFLFMILIWSRFLLFLLVLSCLYLLLTQYVFLSAICFAVVIAVFALAIAAIVTTFLHSTGRRIHVDPVAALNSVFEVL